MWNHEGAKRPQHIALLAALLDNSERAAQRIGYVDAQIENVAAEGAAWSEDRAAEEALMG